MSEENELRRHHIDKMRLELDADRAAVDAERAAVAAERAAKESAEPTAKEGIGAGNEQRIQQPSAGQQVPEQGCRSQTGMPLVMSQSSMRVPKFDGQNVHLWSSRF